jgi:hypothetical protein
LPAIIADQHPDLVVPTAISADVRSHSWMLMREKDSATAVGQVFDTLHSAFGSE